MPDNVVITAEDLPSGTPARRFCRYVRGTGGSDKPLFPRDGTIGELALAIDIATLPEALLEDEDFMAVLQRPDIRIQLIHLAGKAPFLRSTPGRPPSPTPTCR